MTKLIDWKAPKKKWYQKAAEYLRRREHVKLGKIYGTSREIISSDCDTIVCDWHDGRG